MTISKNKGIFSSPVLDGKEDSPSPFWCSKKPFARLVFLCYFEGTVPSGVQTPAPLKLMFAQDNEFFRGVPSGVQTPAPLKHVQAVVPRQHFLFHPECKLRLH